MKAISQRSPDHQAAQLEHIESYFRIYYNLKYKSVTVIKVTKRQLYGTSVLISNLYPLVFIIEYSILHAFVHCFYQVIDLLWDWIVFTQIPKRSFGNVAHGFSIKNDELMLSLRCTRSRGGVVDRWLACRPGVTRSMSHRSWTERKRPWLLGRPGLNCVNERGYRKVKSGFVILITSNTQCRLIYTIMDDITIFAIRLICGKGFVLLALFFVSNMRLSGRCRKVFHL